MSLRTSLALMTALLPAALAAQPMQRRLLRFVGRGLEANSTTFVACTGSSFATSE